MSGKASSPTATVLRSSRLFSMPPPLARPGNDLLHRNSSRVSESATLPYPVQQAVTVPKSSLSRGDWGFKRSLPLRTTTNTSTPYLRINMVDTREHITDYASAADLSLTQKKFQELQLPITVDAPKIPAQGASRAKSAFEAYLDNTDTEVMHTDNSVTKWKYKGPAIAGLKPGDFEKFLKREVKGRMREFMEFVRQHRIQELQREKRADERNAAQEGNEVDTTPVSVSDEELAAYIQTLRSNYVLTSVLARLVERFLDLPPVPQNRTTSFADIYGKEDAGQPVTHPSAGMSYVRTNAFLENHPLLGPQRFHTPVQSRVLGFDSSATLFGSRQPVGTIGIAGVVSEGTAIHNRKRVKPSDHDEEDRLQQRDFQGRNVGLNTTGGNRLWVEPIRASIDSAGRLIVKAANADVVAVGVKTGELAGPPLQPADGPQGRHAAGKRTPVSLSPFANR